MPLAALMLMLAAAAPASQSAPPPPAVRPVVALDIVQGAKALGTVTIELDPAKAPVTVENFLGYVRAGHYDGTIFHRVIPDFMIQGGNLTPELEERPTRPAIVNESRNARRNARGTVAMARLNEANSATDQFFINLKANHMLDWGIMGAGYAVFGEVIKGMDVVDEIARTPTSTRGPYENVPETSVIIQRAYVVTPEPSAEQPKAGEQPQTEQPQTVQSKAREQKP